MQNQEQPFISQFPTAFREHIALNDAKFPAGAYRLGKLSPEVRETVIDAIMVAGHTPSTHISVAATQHVSTIKENLLALQNKEVQKVIENILTERISILRKEEDRLSKQQRDDTKDYEETLRTKGSVTLAPRTSDFCFSSWSVNVFMYVDSLRDNSQEAFQKNFKFENRPWANRALLEACSDEVFDTSVMSMGQAMRQHDSAEWTLPLYRISLIHETYGPYLNDYYSMIFGAPGILDPLQGISFTNKAEQKIWDERHDLKIFSKSDRGLSLLLDVSSIPELSHVFQKQYRINFEYYDNHSSGW